MVVAHGAQANSAHSEQQRRDNDEDEQKIDVAVERAFHGWELGASLHRVHLNLALHASINSDANEPVCLLQLTAPKAHVVGSHCRHLRPRVHPQLAAQAIELVIWLVNEDCGLQLSMQCSGCGQVRGGAHGKIALEIALAVQVRGLDETQA